MHIVKYGNCTFSFVLSLFFTLHLRYHLLIGLLFHLHRVIGVTHGACNHRACAMCSCIFLRGMQPPSPDHAHEFDAEVEINLNLLSLSHPCCVESER